MTDFTVDTLSCANSVLDGNLPPVHSLVMTDRNARPVTTTVIEIPAGEFGALAPGSAGSSPPPARFLERACARAGSDDHRQWQRRLADAALARHASLDALRTRCRGHMDHVSSVVKGVKESRRLESVARRVEIRDSLDKAGVRRSMILERRTEEKAVERARRARIVREMTERGRKESAEEAEDARKDAALRRGRYLGERKARAAKFSPPRNTPEVPSIPSNIYAEDDEERSSTASRSSDKSDPTSDMDTSSSASDDVSRRLFPCDLSSSISGFLPLSLADTAVTPHAPSSAFVTTPPRQESAARVARHGPAHKAAKRIASFYLLHKARSALIGAGALGSRFATYSFAEVTACIESPHTQQAADLVFRMLGLRLPGRPQTPRDIARERTERRVLLSSLVIALHPDSVVEDKQRNLSVGGGGGSSTDDCMVVSAARRMLLCLYVGTAGAIASAWAMWRRTFIAWKKRDAQNLLHAMIEDAVATAALRIAVHGRFAENAEAHAVASALGTVEGSVADAKAEHAVWDMQISAKQAKIRDAVTKLSGREGLRRLDAALSASHHAQDEHLVHEIMIDLQGLLRRISDTPPELDNMVWATLQSELCMVPPGRAELSSRVAYIARGLNSMIPGSFSLDPAHAEVDLDCDFAVSFIARAANALKRSQAEAQDKMLEEWLEASALRLRASEADFVSTIVSVLQELTQLVDRTQRSILFFRVRDSAPVIQQYGAAWERSHFEGRIMAGEFSRELPRTYNALREGLLSEPLLRTVSLEEIREGKAGSACQLFRVILTRLAAQSRACTREDVPEILYMDVERIVEVQNQMQKCALLATIDNMARQFLHSRRMPGPDLRECRAVLNIDSTRLSDIQAAFVACVREVAERSSQVLLESDIIVLKNMIERSTRPEDGTFRLLHKRTHEVVEQLILVPVRERDQACMTPKGLAAVSKGDILRIVGALERLASHASQVHGAKLVELAKVL